jgi:signal transduction histidine kinase
MAVLAQEESFPLNSRVSRQVDGALVTLRWFLIALVWVTVAFVTGSFLPESYFLLWLITYAVLNALLSIGVRYRRLPDRLPMLGLIGDILAFSVLPLLPGLNSPFLILFGIFPTLVAALRFGVKWGIAVAAFVLIPYELSTIFHIGSAAGANSSAAEVNWFSAFFPVLALVSAVVVVGFLAQREREAAVGRAGIELEELRRNLASAQLLYDSSATLSDTANYVNILEMMIQAGVSGMPRGSIDQPSPVGLVLLFRDPLPDESHKMLAVAASRGLDRADIPRVVSGTQGIIARALDSGDPIPFNKTSNDPELVKFSTMRRVRTGVCYPLASGLDVYGVVILATPSSRMPEEQHLRVMRAFVNQAAIAFQNAQLYQNLRLERDRIIEAESTARAKLARDLHDGPTQATAALAMRLDFIRLLLDRDPVQAKQELEQAREAVMRIGKDLRGMLFTLRPLTLETQGLSAALKQYEQRLRETDSVPITIHAGSFGPDLDPNIAGTAFAVIEEAVNNARKHGAGAPIQVSVYQQSGSLIAIIRDEGPGFDVQAVTANYAERGSLGMVNMRDRARLVDGKFTIESSPGKGTRVTLTIPLKNDRTKYRPEGRHR